jgi:hypothetical protein
VVLCFDINYSLSSKKGVDHRKRRAWLNGPDALLDFLVRAQRSSSGASLVIGEGQHRHMARALDLTCNQALVFGCQARLTPGTNLAPIGQEAAQHIDLLVVWGGIGCVKVIFLTPASPATPTLAGAIGAGPALLSLLSVSLAIFTHWDVSSYVLLVMVVWPGRRLEGKIVPIKCID